MLKEKTKAKQEDTSTSQSKSNGGTYADHSDNFNYSVEPIEGTPMTMVKTEEGYRITLGRHAITQVHKTEKEALSMMPQGDIDTLLTIMATVAQNVYNKLKEDEHN